MNKLFVPEPTINEFTAGEWKAFLHLNFANTARGVRLVAKEHQGPLYVQKPFYPEGLSTPHIYLLHPPGGLVSGDQLEIKVNVDAQANAVITTPGAGRMYKARADQALQTQKIILNVAPEGSIEWLPLEAILFPGANAAMDTQINLDTDAHFIYWDILSLGLPVRGDTFSTGQFNQNLKVYSQGKLKIQERLVINDSNRAQLTANAGFQNYPIQGVMIAGPFSTPVDELIDGIRNKIKESGLLASVTLVDGFLVIRNLANCSERARLLFEKIWSDVRPALLSKKACPPRIWNT